METQSIYCPSCRRENKVGNRFCRFCGRLLVEPDAEAMDYAPPYSTEDGAPGADGAAQPDMARARLLIRALPTDTQDSFAGVPSRVGEYALQGRTVTIGRAHNCDIVFSDDNLTSRRHAILRREAHYYTIADLGSSNGTFLNDVEVRERMPLQHGDRLLIGQHELLFLLEQPQPITAPQANAAAAAADAPGAVELAPATAGPGDAAPPVAEAASLVGVGAEVGPTALLTPTPDMVALDNGPTPLDALDTLPEAPPEAPPEVAAEPAAELEEAGLEEAQPAGPTEARVTGRPALETGEIGATGKYASVAQLSSEVAASAWRLMAPPSEGDDLDAMRARLREASDALTRQAGLQAALAEQRRRVIAAISADLGDLIASLRGDDSAVGSAGSAGAGRGGRATRPGKGGWEAEREQTLRTLEGIFARLQEHD